MEEADDVTKKMSGVEEELIQVNMKSSEGNLVFPNKLNERFDAFSHVIDGANDAPTQPQYEVFKLLSSQLDEQVAKWAQIKKDEVPKISAQIAQLNLPALIIKPAQQPAATATPAVTPTPSSSATPTP